MRKWAILDTGGECVNNAIFLKGNSAIGIKTLSGYCVILSTLFDGVSPKEIIVDMFKDQAT